MSVIHLIDPTENRENQGCAVPPVDSDAKLSRRTLLKWTGLSATALILATALSNQAQAIPAEPEEEDPTVGMLIDLTRCTGCQSCSLACQVANERRETVAPPSRLSSDAYSYVSSIALTAGDDQSEAIYVKRQCMHCVHPACVSACTVGALQKTATGPVIYDASKCIGCRYCQYACPFGVPTYDWDNALGLIHKCQMCAARQQLGKVPACIAACPNGALRFGKRHELLAQAHAQIATAPERYINHVYGESEAGGTAVLYLSAVPFESLGFPQLDPVPIPHDAEMVMARTPLIALGVATVATVLHRLTKPHAASETIIPAPHQAVCDQERVLPTTDDGGRQ